MPDRLEELKKELVQEIQSLANELANNQSFVGLLSYESKFKLLHEKFINLKFLERKHIGLDVFDEPIPVEEEKQEVFSVSDKRYEDEQVNEYFFDGKKIDETPQEASDLTSNVVDYTKQTIDDIEEDTVKETTAQSTSHTSAETTAPQDSLTDITASEVDDFSDLLPKAKQYPKIQVDFNDRLAFLNQLFDGDSNKMESTLSTLNHMDTYTNSKKYIEDLTQENNWSDKEEYIERLMELVSKRFD